MCAFSQDLADRGEDVGSAGGREEAAAAAEGAEAPLRKRPRFSNPAYDILGYGWIVHDVGRPGLDAHCGRPEHHLNPKNACRLNRKLLAGPKSSGRPLGLVIAWLFAHRGCQETHHNMCVKRLQTPEDLEDLSWERRSCARIWAREHGLGFLEGLEAPKKSPSDPDEPYEFQ
jgi:hypothetical protein